MNRGNGKGNLFYSNQINCQSYFPSNQHYHNNAYPPQRQIMNAPNSYFANTIQSQNLRVYPQPMNMGNQPQMFPFYYAQNYVMPQMKPNMYQMNQMMYPCMQSQVQNQSRFQGKDQQQYNRAQKSQNVTKEVVDKTMQKQVYTTQNSLSNSNSNISRSSSKLNLTSDLEDSDEIREQQLLESMNQVLLESNLNSTSKGDEFSVNIKDNKSMEQQNGGNTINDPYDYWLNKLLLLRSSKDHKNSNEAIINCEENICLSIVEILNKSSSKYVELLNGIIGFFSNERISKIWKTLIESNVLIKFSTCEYNYSFIEKLLSVTQESSQKAILAALNKSFYSLSYDTYGTFILQKLVSFKDKKCRIEKLIISKFPDMVVNKNAVLVINAFVETLKSDPKKISDFYNFIFPWLNLLVKNQYGISLLVKVLQIIPEKLTNEIIDSLKGRFVKLSMHKHAFYVIQILIEKKHAVSLFI